jgi:PBP1b-binding outer membrane lipoprotein LpoB
MLKGEFMKKIVLLALILFISSCSNNINMVSKKRLQPYQGNVTVFFAKNDCTNIENQLPTEYTVMAELSYYNLGKFRGISVEDVTSWFKADAQQIGANAIIIDSCNTVYSGIVSRGKNVKGRAILIEEKSI